MRRLFFFLFVACSAIAQTSPIPNDCRQLVVVVTKDWAEVDGEMRCFQRSENGAWKLRGQPINIVVGRKGLAVASGVHPPLADEDKFPRKHEGDGCSPAGVFALPYAFGYARTNDATWIKLPYVHCTNTFECVDDGSSIYYNQVIDARFASKHDWKSSEQMLRKDILYRWGVFVDHNARKVGGDGSCIFLHLWEGPHKGTTGCTAMEEVDLKRVIGWLDPKAKPLLVQFPEREYLQLQKSWQLPMIRQ